MGEITRKQSRKVEFIVNQKAAKQIGRPIPPAGLARGEMKQVFLALAAEDDIDAGKH